MKNRKIIYVALSVAILILNALPIILMNDAAITKYSIVSIAFAVCSVVYAVIAFILKDKGNLFVAGKHWLYRVISLTFYENVSNTQNEEYKKEFELSAFVYCVTVPSYITISFFANEFFSALSQAVSWAIIRQIAIIIVVIVPHAIRNIKEKKRQRIKDEADRKEQEHQESMGKWK